MIGAEAPRARRVQVSQRPGAPGRKRRMMANHKQEAVLRVLRGEPLEVVARDLRVMAADVSGWRDGFLDGGAASLESRPRDPGVAAPR